MPKRTNQVLHTISPPLRNKDSQTSFQELLLTSRNNLLLLYAQNCSVYMMHACMLGHFSHVRLCNPMNYSPPGSSVGFSRQKYGSGLPCPPPGISSRPRDRTCISLCFVQEGSLPLAPPGKPIYVVTELYLRDTVKE